MTTTSPEALVALLSRALEQTGAVIAGIRPEQAALPTPCRSWDLRALVGHVVDELHQFALVAAGERRRALDGDLLGDDWTGAYRTAADALLTAWRQPGALERTHRYPGGEVPATAAVGQNITELAAHTWDIAKATGRSTDDLDPEVARFALEWDQAHDDPRFRGDEADGFQVAPQVPVTDDAPPYDRLAAFGGRDPSWAPGAV
ncbi:TIGR03086 family metal-binding protein [Planomonospora algeriensis]